MKQSDLDILLHEGEGFMLEYKESLSSSLARELVAFANSTGGKILPTSKKGHRVTGEVRGEVTGKVWGEVGTKLGPSSDQVTEQVTEQVASIELV